MPNIAKVLKEEITRLARKEVRTALEKTSGATAQHRRDIADLKKLIASLKRQVAALEKRGPATEAVQRAATGSTQRRFVPKGLVSTRRHLGLSAADLAKMMGVSAQTIYNWEHGVTKPRPEQLAKLGSLRNVGKRQVQAHLAASQ